MKLSFNKNLEGGSYKLTVSISFDPADLELIRKFGSPMISVAPQSTVLKNPQGAWQIVSLLPIHDLNNRNFTFTAEEKAITFVETLGTRVKEAMLELRKKRDNFTGVQVEEI